MFKHRIIGIIAKLQISLVPTMTLEKICHWTVWTVSILIALFKFKKSTEHQPFISPDDFTKGWDILEPRLKDNSDLEWLILSSTFKKYWGLLALQVACSHVILRTVPKLLPFFYTFYSGSCLVWVVGVRITTTFLLPPTILFVTHATGKKSPCYALTVAALVALHHPAVVTIKESFSLGESNSFLFDVGLGWMMAKSLSFAIDRIDSGKYRQLTLSDIAEVLAYCLYLPVVFTGPILTYKVFRDQLRSSCQMLPSGERLFRSLLRLLYRATWCLVYEFLLHYVYSSAVQFDPNLARSLDGWSLCGLGYALPMMFYLKYYVIYGVAGGVAHLEGIEFAPPPKCISAVHRSSFLWRHFDRGLYLWILRYLYRPLVAGHWTAPRKAFALSTCFGFVCLWHGMERAVCAWCALNCCLVLSEMVTPLFMTSKFGKRLQSLSESTHKRVEAVASTPHFILMCISCDFFLSNWNIGVVLVEKVLLGGIVPLLPLAAVMYCGCHVSMDSKKWQLTT